MEELYQILQEEMTTKQLRQNENYNKHRKPDRNLKSGNMVRFLPCNVKSMRQAMKLGYKKIGPFNIIKKVWLSNYKLDLPATMSIHNTFHIQLIEPYENNKLVSQIQTAPPPIEIEGKHKYELEEIIDSHIHQNNSPY